MVEQTQPQKIEGEQEQQLLLSIVETWTPNPFPTYRGFKCGNCQEFKDEAWFHWLNKGDYKLPVHMCSDKCEPTFQSGGIHIDDEKRKTVERETFGDSNPYPETAVKRFTEIIASWADYEPPKLKAFTCDDCDGELNMETLPDGTEQRQGYHVWWKMPDNKTLAELHFHKDCGHKIGVYSKEELEQLKNTSEPISI